MMWRSCLMSLWRCSRRRCSFCHFPPHILPRPPGRDGIYFLHGHQSGRKTWKRGFFKGYALDDPLPPPLEARCRVRFAPSWLHRSRGNMALENISSV